MAPAKSTYCVESAGQRREREKVPLEQFPAVAIRRPISPLACVEIKAAGNAKRSAAAKMQPRKPDGKMGAKPVVDHSEQPPAKPKVAVAREARAAEARVSPATMGRAEQIG